MRLIDRLRPSPEAARADLPEWQSVFTTTYQQGTTESVLPVFNSFANDGYKGNSIVFSVILARLMLFSEAEFKFQSLADKRMFGTTDLYLLENPWPGGTTGDLLARMEQDVSLAGSAFIRNCGDHLERLRPDWVDIVSADLGDRSGSLPATSTAATTGRRRRTASSTRRTR